MKAAPRPARRRGAGEGDATRDAQEDELQEVVVEVVDVG
jgi:hypothetical protein